MKTEDVRKKKESGYDEGKPWYNSKRGIKGALTSLDDFIELVSERRNAGYRKKERLNEFYVLGRYYMDACGNCHKIFGWIPKEKFPGISNVITSDELWEHIKRCIENPDEISISSGANSDLPIDKVTCPVCKKGWTIDNCHDTVVHGATVVFPLTEFVGKTLGDVKNHYKAKTDARYLMQDDILIRNDKYIDLTLNPDFPTLKTNELGWVGSREGINDKHIIEEGDEGHFNVWKYYHGMCNNLNLAFKEEKEFREVFKTAGFNFVCLHHLPNEYCPCDKCAPWFRVKTEIGAITIGWRKRVINIDWSEIDSDKDIISLFRGENVTKGNYSIHAWGWDKATEYLSKIYKELSV